jgi:hypothetical protein
MRGDAWRCVGMHGRRADRAHPPGGTSHRFALGCWRIWSVWQASIRCGPSVHQSASRSSDNARLHAARLTLRYSSELARQPSGSSAGR